MAETTELPVEYDVNDIPLFTALSLISSSPSAPDDFDDMPESPEDRRLFVYKYYNANAMASSLWSVGWERGVERQNLRVIEADEVNEGDELDQDEAAWHYLFGYLSGQYASYGVWATAYTKDSDDTFFDDVEEADEA